MLIIDRMNLNTFDLNLLRVLDALLRERSVTRAGARIGLSQPAVSSALGRLRETLGDPLLIRRGQSMVPTDYARSLEDPLRELLDKAEGILAGPPAFDPSRANEVFRISGSDFFADVLMPVLVDRLAHVAPGVRVQLVDLVPGDHVGTLERYESDIALVPDEDLPGWVDRRPVFRSSFVAVARRDNARLLDVPDGAVIPIDLFCALGHVLFSPQGKMSAMGDAALARIGRKRRVICTMPAFSGVAWTVSQSDHIALVPRQYGERFASELGLRVFKAPMPIDPAMITMVWHRRSTGAPAHRWLRTTVADILLPLNEGDPLPDG